MTDQQPMTELGMNSTSEGDNEDMDTTEHC